MTGSPTHKRPHSPQSPLTPCNTMGQASCPSSRVSTHTNTYGKSTHLLLQRNGPSLGCETQCERWHPGSTGVAGSDAGFLAGKPEVIPDLKSGSGRFGPSLPRPDCRPNDRCASLQGSCETTHCFIRGLSFCSMSIARNLDRISMSVGFSGSPRVDSSCLSGQTRCLPSRR